MDDRDGALECGPGPNLDLVFGKEGEGEPEVVVNSRASGVRCDAGYRSRIYIEALISVREAGKGRLAVEPGFIQFDADE